MKITDNFPLSFFNDIPNGIFLLILAGSFGSRGYCCCRRHWWQRLSEPAKLCRPPHCRRRMTNEETAKKISIFLSHIGCASVFSMWFAALFSTRAHDTSRTHAALHLSIVVRWPLLFLLFSLVIVRSVSHRVWYFFFYPSFSQAFVTVAGDCIYVEWGKKRTNWNRYW